MVDVVALGVFVPLVVLVVGPTLVFMVMMVARRRVYPLNGRDLTLVIPSQILIAFNLAVTAQGALSPPPCVAGTITDIFVPALAIICNVFRLLRMVFLYKFAQENLKIHKEGMDTDKKKKSSQWYANHRYMIEPTWMWKVITPLASIFVIVGLLIYVLSTDLPAGDRQDGPCPRVQRTRALQIFLYVSLLSVLSYTIWLVRKVQDGFFIKREFKFVALFTFVMIVFNMLRGQHVDVSPNFPLTELLACVGYSFFLAIPIWYPLYLSYSKTSRQCGSLSTIEHTQTRSSGASFIKLLTDDEHKSDRQDFEQLLIKEFSVENLMFFDAVRSFEQLIVDKGFESNRSEIKSVAIPTASTVEGPQSPSCPETPLCGNELVDDEGVGEAPLSVAQHSLRALEIYQRFVSREAPYEVNLSHKVFEQTEREINAHFGATLVKTFCEEADGDGDLISTVKFEASEPIRSDVFTVAQNHILKLMKSDTYVRWTIIRREESKVTASAESRTEAPVGTHFEEENVIEV